MTYSQQFPPLALWQVICLDGAQILRQKLNYLSKILGVPKNAFIWGLRAAKRPWKALDRVGSTRDGNISWGKSCHRVHSKFSEPSWPLELFVRSSDPITQRMRKWDFTSRFVLLFFSLLPHFLFFSSRSLLFSLRFITLMLLSLFFLFFILYLFIFFILYSLILLFICTLSFIPYLFLIICILD